MSYLQPFFLAYSYSHNHFHRKRYNDLLPICLQLRVDIRNEATCSNPVQLIDKPSMSLTDKIAFLIVPAIKAEPYQKS